MIGDFLDEAIIKVQAGKGGDGAISFRREKYVEKGGPDGGDGGDGGSIIIKSTLNKNTLIDFKYKKIFKAANGENGKNKKRFGKSGKNLIIEVPVGTCVYDQENNALIADMKHPEQYVVVAVGGKGGRGNAKFATSTLQVPQIAEKGIKGESKTLKLVLKIVADVGLIGYPNVGKSTLISKISEAKVEIADYPFTTITPNLGVVKLKDNTSFVVADIPGLIEGAHLGKGLGDKFLRHVERCLAIVHIIDISGLEREDPVEDYYAIRKELESFSYVLSQKKELIVANKMDTVEKEELERKLSDFKSRTGKEIFPISAYTGENINIFIERVWDLMKQEKIALQKNLERKLKKFEKPKLKITPVKFEPDSHFRINIVKLGEEVFEVAGESVEKLLARYDINQKDSRLLILDTLEKNGLTKILMESGVKEGDTVYIGDFAFEYIPD
ncbi:GTPase ObgE [Petrotoga sp. 9PWA.NaAc.5.4]|uniref:GTPase ObgE n=1 Tax=Petrotoga sp. 9PWA.NaAc.5.4 TaxID=1434328 RepID=UPI000CAA3FFE|nr:GTPase ObgE [Petrotoga sp. 9PWA.NaAc.5.4]PNR96628.1 GTPase CgtA [Petrotoga sp. 9PWA.NaAc.5.4]